MRPISHHIFEQITSDPSAHYRVPEDVVKDERLTKAQKIMVLKLWAFDAKEIEVAQEENMIGEASPLQQILLLLRDIQNS